MVILGVDHVGCFVSFILFSVWSMRIVSRNVEFAPIMMATANLSESSIVTSSGVSM